ncbi:hypothetical protein, partial [Rubneribacter badeniensis]|uniref:hypothetical protein n=1 Tax=Rubneribacter badeniensis TaxID=2070688 RepID=UPI003A92A886
FGAHHDPLDADRCEQQALHPSGGTPVPKQQTLHLSSKVPASDGKHCSRAAEAPFQSGSHRERTTRYGRSTAL